MRLAFALALTASLALAAPSSAQDPVAIKWNLKENDSFYAKSVADMEIGMTILNMNIDVKMKVTTVQRYTVVSAKPGATKVEMVMVDMKMETEGLPAALPGLDDLGKRIKGATITATLNDNLDVTKLEGYDKYIDKLADGDEAARKQMKAQFPESAVSQMVTQVFSFTPKNAVKIGDTWTRTDKVPTGGFGDASVKQKYKLDSVKDGVAKLNLDVEMTFKADGGAIPGLPDGVKISKFDMKPEKATGTLLFDTKAGRLKENKQNMTINGDITMSANGMDIDMKMKIKAVQTTTLSDKNPIKD